MRVMMLRKIFSRTCPPRGEHLTKLASKKSLKGASRLAETVMCSLEVSF